MIVDYVQVCTDCARDRLLEHCHHGLCEECDESKLVGLTRAVASQILWPTYD
jgi:hypothetical protein